MEAGMRSLIFTQYNKARVVPVLEKRRVRKALSLILSGEIEHKRFEYGTTVKDCNCLDRSERKVICKHMIACMILYRAYEMAQRLFLGELNNSKWNRFSLERR